MFKLIIVGLVASAVASSGNTLPLDDAKGPSAAACGTPSGIFRRAYNVDIGDWFYSTDPVTIENLVRTGQWEARGDAALVFQTQDASSVPLYQMYNSATTDHIFTINTQERDALVSQGWDNQGIVAYMFSSGDCGGSVPFYRMFNPLLNEHFYTVNETEKLNAINTMDYVDEGVAAFVFPP